MSAAPEFIPALAWPAELPDHLSYSSLSMLERCPEQWRRRYVLGEKTPPSGSLLWGRADGRAHAHNFAQKIQSHEDVPRAEVQEAFAWLLDEEVEDSGGAGEVDWGSDKPGEVKDRGAALVGAYHDQVSPRVQPTAIEEAFSLELPGVPVPLVGYIDVSTVSHSIERKTASQKSSAVPVQYRLQTLAYAAARRLPVEVHISTRTIKPAVYTPVEEPGLVWQFEDALIGRTTRIVQARVKQLLALWETFGPDQPWPDAIGSMAWHTPICELCGWGPNGNNACPWWR